ncbi:hypothetical protein BB560_000332 [Smittium megazygosporum]|uniref:RNA helicase n=1 Tax=Smittium megazygosporum TaxID=133381 RepID=A0A2T9ZKS1_9FUNG|nr:hypothetical protein BB560_000332 [Smittium megazygosporum]
MFSLSSRFPKLYRGSNLHLSNTRYPKALCSLNQVSGGFTLKSTDKLRNQFSTSTIAHSSSRSRKPRNFKTPDTKKYASKSPLPLKGVKSTNNIQSQMLNRNSNSSSYPKNSKNTTTKVAKSGADSKLSRKDSRNKTKQIKLPGVSFIPSRFQLVTVKNESNTEHLPIVKKTKNGKIIGSLNAKEISNLLKTSTFENLGLDSNILQAGKSFITQRIKNMKNTFSFPSSSEQTPENLKPTPIQTLAVPEILALDNPDLAQDSSNVLFLASETGSGKTLAYLLPLIQLLKREEIKLTARTENTSDAENENTSTEADSSDINSGKLQLPSLSPRAVIIVPTHDLAAQIVQVSKYLCHIIKFSVLHVESISKVRKKISSSENPIIDIAIGTPLSLERAFSENELLSLENSRYFVIDEADTIMDDKTHLDTTMKILRSVQNEDDLSSKKVQENIIFVSATLPKSIYKSIQDIYPDITFVSTPNLHLVNPKIKVNNINVSHDFQGSKINALTQVLKENPKDKKTLVFCNTVDACIELYAKLLLFNYPVLLLTGRLKGSSNISEGKRKGSRGFGSKYNKQDNDDQDDQDDQDDDTTEQKYYFHGKSHQNIITSIDEIDPLALRKFAFKTFSSDLPIPKVKIDRLKLSQSLKIDHKFSKGAFQEDLLKPSDFDFQGTKILISTDLGSRGLDTTFVDHVIMYDYPTTAINYLHRCGRTGRVATKGKVTTLIGSRDFRNVKRVEVLLKSNSKAR